MTFFHVLQEHISDVLRPFGISLFQVINKIGGIMRCFLSPLSTASISGILCSQLFTITDHSKQYYSIICVFHARLYFYLFSYSGSHAFTPFHHPFCIVH
ncbi:hypothetical protein TELCIR_00963 [Teladorsagia circumcincta]|uniref:Uncharacterized protein n=1 Tax=Teladorsagia circumcincta TaxID=45464 RepID=A0A2G9V366_TELCI|nr:hypothetical protein TELCIR_00963 [Teladorsagia circumcincta]